MEILIQETKVTVIGEKILGFALNHLVNTLSATVDTTPEWEYKLNVIMTTTKQGNIIQLTRTGDIISVDLTADMLPTGGKYKMQFVGINTGTSEPEKQAVYHTEIFDVWVENSLYPAGTYEPIPTEFYQIEQRMEGILEECQRIYDEISTGDVGPVKIHNETPTAHQNIELDCGEVT